MAYGFLSSEKQDRDRPAAAHAGHDRVHLLLYGARAGDLLVVAGAALLANVLRHGLEWPQSSYIFPILVGLMAFVLASGRLDAYQVARIGGIGHAMARLAGAWGLAWTVVLLSCVLSKTTEDYSRLWLALWLLTALVGLSLSRLALWFTLAGADRGAGLHERVALLRVSDRRAGVAGLLGGFPLRIVEEIQVAGGRGWAGGLDQAVARIKALTGGRQIDRVLVAADLGDDERLDKLLEAMRFLPIEVSLLPPDASLRRAVPEGRVPVLDTVSKRALTPADRAAKRLFDLVVGSLLLLLALPLCLAIAAAIRLEGPGSVLFRQSRSGIGEARFTVLKFRTMRCGPCGDGSVPQTSRSDPRVTRVGRLLRRTSLDELPQLANVVRGEMSLVGPRPHAVEHDATFAAALREYMMRHRVKPGMTGLAQVSGSRGEIRSLEALRRRVDLDLWYIDNWSLWLDFTILVRTAFHMVGRNVY